MTASIFWPAFAPVSRAEMQNPGFVAVKGFLLDECVMGLAKDLEVLIDLPVLTIPDDLRGRADETVHGLAYAQDYAIITADSGKNDGSGFCTQNGMEAARNGVILLPHKHLTDLLNLLLTHEPEIELYLGMPARKDFYLDLTKDMPEMMAWGMGLRKGNSKIKSAVAVTYTDGLNCCLTPNGLKIIEGDVVKLNPFALNAARAEQGKEIQIGITYNAADSMELPDALRYIARQDGSAYRIKSCRNGAIEIMEGRKSIMKFYPDPKHGFNI